MSAADPLLLTVGLVDLIAAGDGQAGERGAFVGYIAPGEGGLPFHRADGRPGAPSPAELLALRAAAPR